MMRFPCCCCSASSVSHFACSPPRSVMPNLGTKLMGKPFLSSVEENQVHGFNISQLEAALAVVLYSQGPPLQEDNVAQQLEVLLEYENP
ncbi:hypothetical protein V6N12_012437 [Hibiscus sabdariffa]|uniref:Uncharacterized protein n=1 Tax=Hibiscus sabdariffa TaxID=183260 RepID=A0ABR2AB92_9ROSI